MTLNAGEELLDRFHRVLVDEIREKRPEYLMQRFTVAEIYQHLIPYGTHRERLGVEMNGDYEDVLLRMLAGQGGYLILESEPARERLREEVGASNPETGLYREFAAVDVRLNPDRLPDERIVQVPEEGDETASGGSDVASATVEEPAAEREEPQRVDSPDESGTGRAPGTCSWCRERLPSRENLNYCPFCGTDVHVVPCPSCGEALEPGWHFCIACGAEVGDGS